MSSLSAPPAVKWVVRTLEEAGFDTWTVGGAVRDILADRPSVDWDFATRARPPEIRRVFRRTVPIGIEHGTVGVLARDGTLYEVTTFRKDVETFGRHAVVEFADRLDDDLSRRDFTINAVAWHPLRDEIHDPHGGVADLRAGVLRTVGRAPDRFAEDYLRILRALRFAGLFELTIDPPTWSALSDAVDHLPELSPERVREELMKILGSDPRPSGSLALYDRSGALEVVYPELAALRDADPSGQGPDPGEDPDLWTRALMAVDALPAARSRLRLAALLHDVGVPGEGGEEAESPREVAAARTAALLMRLRFSNADTDRVTQLVRAGARLPPADADGATLRRWLHRVGPERMADVVRLAGARARVREALGDRDRLDRRHGPDGPATVADVAASARALRAEARRRPPLDVGDLAVDGRDLIRMGLSPGRRFGEILDDVLTRVLEDPGLNEPQALERLIRREVAPDLFEGPEANPAGSGG